MSYEKLYKIIDTLKDSIDELKSNHKKEEKDNKKFKLYINGIYAGEAGAISYSVFRPVAGWSYNGNAIRGKKTISFTLMDIKILEKFTDIMAGDKMSIVGENPSDGKALCMRLTHFMINSSDKYVVSLSAEDLEFISL